MLKVNNIHKEFDHHAVLKGAHCDAHDGELLIIEGQNGAGKSTLFNILAGSIEADRGSVLLDGQEILSLSPQKRAQLIGILIQDPKMSSVGSMTLLENCALAALKSRRASMTFALKDDTVKKIRAHLDALGIDYLPHLNKPMGTLSGGQRQIGAFAMATLQRPKLLLLDEPSAALDEKSSQLLMSLVKRLIAQWQIPAVMISHDKELNRTYGDRIIRLEAGVLSEGVFFAGKNR